MKFNYDRCLNPEQKCPQRGNHAKIKEVQVVDDYVVVNLLVDLFVGLIDPRIRLAG